MNKVDRLRKSFPRLTDFNVETILKTPSRFNTYKPYKSLLRGSMAYRDHVKTLKINYELTRHAQFRIETRNLSEEDVRMTITHGTVSKNPHGYDTYMYEYKYFRVAVDREVTLESNEVVVITAMIALPFVELVLRANNMFMANKKSITNALKYVYDEMGDLMYGNSNRVFRILREYGFVERDSFFGESILSTYDGRGGKLELDTDMDIVALRSKLEQYHNQLFSGNTINVLKTKLGMTSDKIEIFRTGGRTYMFDRKLFPKFNEAYSEILKRMLDETIDTIVLYHGDLRVIRGSRFDLTVTDVGDVSWVVNFDHHKYYLALRERYSVYAFSRSSFTSILNTYVDALGLYTYASEDYEKKEAYLIGMLRSSNKYKMEVTLQYQKSYLAEHGLSIG